MKSELAIKRDEWFASEEGERCLDVKNLALHASHQKYLKHRLEAAFLAGAEANEQVHQDLADQVMETVRGSREK